MSDHKLPEGSLPAAGVDNRKNVGMAKPDGYPERDRDDGDVTGAANRGRRPNKGSGPVSGSGAGAGGKGNAEDYDSDPQGGGGAAPGTDNGPKTGADAPVGGSR